MKKPLSSIHPVIERCSVFLRRFKRRMKWYFEGVPCSLNLSEDILPVSVMNHQSLLLRKLEGTNQTLQRNKVDSLRKACKSMDGVLIYPGETFSFWKLVGHPTESRGFPQGLQLSFGKLVSRTGGGLCQLSNLLHWMILHTPLTVTERHRHDFDPFPDYRRTVPFGTGATVFYNYLDFMFRNDTEYVFQVRTWLDDMYLHGEIRADRKLPFYRTIQERNHRFVRIRGEVYRENELWRIITDSENSMEISEELLIRNQLKVQYDTSAVPGIEVIELS